MKKLLLAATAALALVPSTGAQEMKECELGSGCGQLRYAVTYNHDKTLSFTMVSAPNYFAKNNINSQIADITKVGGVQTVTNYQYTTEATYEPGEEVSFKWYLAFEGGLADAVQTFTVPETTASATEASWAMGVHEVISTETTMTIHYVFLNVTPKVESNPESFIAQIGFEGQPDTDPQTTVEGAIVKEGLTAGTTYACYVKGKVDGRNCINFDRTFHFSTDGTSGENPEQPVNWTLGDFTFDFSNPTQTAGNSANSVNLHFDYDWANEKGAPVKEVIFGAVAAAGDRLDGFEYGEWPGDGGILVGQTTVSAADLKAKDNVTMLIDGVRSNGGTTLYMKSVIVLEDGKRIDGHGKVWSVDPSQFVGERTITSTCSANADVFTYEIVYHGFTDADVKSVNVYLVKGGQGIGSHSYEVAGRTGSLTIPVDGYGSYWVKARIEFTDGTTKDFNLNNDEALNFNKEETGIPAHMTTMQKLNAVPGWYNGNVVAANFDDDNNVILEFPSYFDAEECQFGLSGHYPQVEGSFAPNFTFSIGNDAKGHIVGVVDIPTPHPVGFVPAIKFNNNAWVQLVGEGAYTKDGQEYYHYYFTSERSRDLGEISYVNGETMSYYFYSGFAGGMHRTRTFSIKIDGSEKTEREHTISNLYRKGGYFSTLGVIGEDADFSSLELYHIDELPEHVAGPSKSEAGWDETNHPNGFGAAMDADGNYPVGYGSQPRYWHPGFTYALGNDPVAAVTDEGSQLSVAIRFDQGTLIPGALVATFDIVAIDEEGKETTLEPHLEMQVVPGEVNLYGGLSKNKYRHTESELEVLAEGDDNAPASAQKLGVKFRFEYISIRPGKGYSTTKLRNYEVSDEDKEHTAIDSVTGDTDADAPVEYYNLQGMRVANPEGGIFIRRQGNRVTKVMVP